eukprot:CAMPEP_0194061788 /NCGR_PEP_ID=MMETSP0009_2-20130614/75623_1 /TAXON_ID=210454 /ORGANISM="Grammatophora oceanica, Strain CCMP 410" /LENGTH=53 /DNA_ID=CAMNT_0038713255 /DNA_START=1 /DNA_END=159 /DNA_ORIENTATION=-
MRIRESLIDGVDEGILSKMAPTKEIQLESQTPTRRGQRIRAATAGGGGSTLRK